MAVSASVLYFLPLGIAVLFDRYLIFFLPLMMVAMARGAGQPRASKSRAVYWLSVALVVAYGLFAIGGTHDYLSWNRARWQALHHLTSELRISPERIDGGFEFNGFYLYDDNYRRERSKSWWWVHRDDFVIAFGPMAGYESMKRYSFARWLPPGRGDIHVLRKLAASSAERKGEDRSHG
jgi:hypothetical protein